MKKIALNLNFSYYNQWDELNDIDKTLLNKAHDTAKSAYAPYSKFKVGAAILMANNKIITGSNQENAAYPSGLCAERVAIFYAGAKFPNVEIKKIAITIISDGKEIKEPIPPCGSCRQSIAEYEIKQKNSIEIIFSSETKKVIKSDSIKNLLPFLFDKEVL